MSLRIIAGRLGGRRIEAPGGNATRPTTDRVREALFNMVQARMSLRDACVLDLFAGSGGLGFEALSRGAKEATFIEAEGRVLSVTRKNASALGLASACRFEKADAFRWLETHRGEKQFDLILVDPPYHDPGVARLPELVRPLLADSGLFVLEHEAGISFGNLPGHVLTRTYGGTGVSLFRH